MFRHRGVPCGQAADWQIGDQREEQAEKYWRIPFGGPKHPIQKSRDQNNADKSLKLAPCGARQTTFIKPGRLRFDIAIHMQVKWKNDEPRVLSNGSGCDD